jgi:hypothetical protein
MNTNSPELVALRRESPDWKETHGVWFALKAGQMLLDEKDATWRLQAMTPENRDRLLSLLHRWVDLTNDAENLHREVESDLISRLLTPA